MVYICIAKKVFQANINPSVGLSYKKQANTDNWNKRTFACDALEKLCTRKVGGKFLSFEKICAGVKNFYGKKLTSTYDFPNGYTICLC